MSTVSPPGGLPYHVNESSAGIDPGKDIIVKTGLAGIFIMSLCTFVTVMMLIISAPFLLLGVAEIVAAAPNSWRVRWIRRDP